MRKNVKSVSLFHMLRELGTRAALLLMAYLMVHRGKKKEVALMISEADLGGHQIKYERKMSRVRNEDGEYEVEEQGHTVFITPTAWIERRRNLVAQAAITEVIDSLIMNEKSKRGSGPRAFTIDGREVLAITAELNDLKTKEIIHGRGYDPITGDEIFWSYMSRPIVRSFLLPSPVNIGGTEWLTVDHRTREGAAFFTKLQSQGWKLQDWTNVPCMLTDAELEELKLLDLMYRVCVDRGLQKQKFLAKSDKKVETIAAIEQERTKGGVAEFSGRPDDGMEGYVGGGLQVFPGKEHKDRTDVTIESTNWSMADEDIYLNGYLVPQRPSKQEFTLDLAWGWNCRLDLTKQMVVMQGEQGQDIWLDTRGAEFKRMYSEAMAHNDGATIARLNKLERRPVLKAEPVLIEVGPKGACTVRVTRGRAKAIEPIGLIRRHLHNLLQLGKATYVLRPYLCQTCNGTGRAPGVDEGGMPMVDDVGQPIMTQCGKCYGSGCGAPGYHIDYRTGLATPNVAGAKVIKSERFACKGKKKPCGNREFMTDIHAEVCTKCGAEMWKNSMIAVFSSQETSEAFELPEEATHSAVQVYGQLVKDMIRARTMRVFAAGLAGKVLPQVIGTKVVLTKRGLMPNIVDSMQVLEYKHEPLPVLGCAEAPVQGCALPPVTTAEWAVKHAEEAHKAHMERLHVEISDGTVLRRLREVASAMRSKRKAKLARLTNKAQIVSNYRKWSKQYLDGKIQVRKEMGS